MAAILFKTECHWKTKQRATIGILNMFSIPAPNVVLYSDDYCFSNDPTILTNKSGVDNKPTLKVKFNFGTNSFGMI